MKWTLDELYICSDASEKGDAVSHESLFLMPLIDRCAHLIISRIKALFPVYFLLISLEWLGIKKIFMVFNLEMVTCQHSIILEQRLFRQTTEIVWRKKKCSKSNDRSSKLCNYEESTFPYEFHMSFNWSNQFEQKPFNFYIVSFHWNIVWNLFRDLFYKRDLLKNRETTITISLFGFQDSSQDDDQIKNILIGSTSVEKHVEI